MSVFWRTLMVTALMVGAVGLQVTPAGAGDQAKQAPTAATKTYKLQVTELREGIEFHRSSTWQWQDVAFRPRIKSNFMERKVNGLGYLRWMANLWSDRRLAARQYALNPPHKSQFLCIHGYEKDPAQGWATKTGNGYYGGLQMDISFQRTYGPRLYKIKGTANNWTPLEQIWVAERAYSSGRGFYPWPNTARYCGLI